MNNNPIGVFDSGIGGLTVVKEIIKVLPNESIIYLGDTERVPYGTKDRETITKFALELTRFLLKKSVKFLVVACNTISATCLEEIEKISPVPVLGVIKPAAVLAAALTKNNKVGVLATRATVSSGAYTRELRKIKSSIEVFTQACPLFVPIIEEGLLDHPIAKIAVDEYLKHGFEGDCDTLILGCTHYPLIEDIIQKTVGSKIKLIDSAKPTARELKRLLTEKKLLDDGKAEYEILLTDTPPIMQKTIDMFFENKTPAKLKKVYL
ncbi:glutamate racemase [Candidatus Daviesbacteria bacterium RIFCSPHIGHO2_02_FULL_36_13]|uniref:Glutamate racemase n=1 Tax=Candidatus Daviesbacteria bacterium RIFCSPHIGHO2_02_FULL_36_13 TaxID=1797768 RepID=A0A1F5JPY9_9BACT|nr:MAG: glutamate racemase [Candidatus Daviesbacteria bacterium RIFCSPHIGHO2_02_FULL_36_13]